MPSNRHATKAILSLIPADFQGKIYDLGSGFGTLAYALARNFPKATIIGFEGSPIPCFTSKLFFRRKNLKFRHKNYLKHDLHHPDLVVCYLCPKGMQKLENREWKELISNTFALRSHTPHQTLQLKDLSRSTLYHYKKS